MSGNCDHLSALFPSSVPPPDCAYGEPKFPVTSFALVSKDPVLLPRWVRTQQSSLRPWLLETLAIVTPALLETDLRLKEPRSRLVWKSFYFFS